MKASYFVFERVKEEPLPCPYQYMGDFDTLSELRKHLNAKLNDGFDAKDFFIIRGREEKITAVKVVAEFETAEN